MKADTVTSSALTPMPLLFYGTAWKKEQTADLVELAVRTGFRAIDTACQPRHYQEEGVGQALQRLEQQGISRAMLFLQTKFTPLSGQDPDRVPYDPKAPFDLQVAQSFASSQRNLKTSYVDSLVLHSPLADHASLMKVWRAMESLQQAGGVRQLGISNCYDLATLRKLHDESVIKPAVLQNRFYAETGYDRMIRTFCQEKNIVYQSFWTLTANPQILASRTVRETAQELGLSAAQIFFRFLTQLGIVPLTGTKSEQHMREDLNIFSFQLSQDVMQRMQRLLE